MNCLLRIEVKRETNTQNTHKKLSKTHTNQRLVMICNLEKQNMNKETQKFNRFKNAITRDIMKSLHKRF